ncbi:hypothetical protein GcM3_084017 [Golovinomyces cichoracearum]|uniref:Uncharacterized protein n=1 Tax=Golovinomyces cichoracearum TaxID=62708 RepID=A0A420ILX7_9PEZI|nr:hypothetical protein GcM3_084017 [Golovinomyces cichoracearum]
MPPRMCVCDPHQSSTNILINGVYYAQTYYSLLPSRLERPRGRTATKKNEEGCQANQAAIEEARGHCRSCAGAEHNRRICREAYT